MSESDRTSRKPRFRIEMADDGSTRRIDLTAQANKLLAMRAAKSVSGNATPQDASSHADERSSRLAGMADRKAKAVARSQEERAGRLRSKMISEALKETKVDGSGPTKLTQIKHQRTSFERMIISKEIGGEMLQAAQEIEAVYMAICGSMIMRGFSFEPKSKAEPAPMAERVAWAHAKRYKPWADALADRARVGAPPVLSLVIDVVVDGRSCKVLDREYNYMSGRTKYLVRRALLEYAVGSGWAMRDAVSKFDAENPKFVVKSRVSKVLKEIA